MHLAQTEKDLFRSERVLEAKKNALAANGQAIALDSSANRLALLCASLDADREVTFLVDGNPVKRTVYSCFERFVFQFLHESQDTRRYSTEIMIL